MEDNIQCPNRGGYKVQNKGDGSFNKAGWVWGCIVLAIFTAGLSLSGIPLVFLLDSKPREDGSIEYLCQLCGYK